MWEDRRHGHTVLLTSFAEPGKAFGAANVLNEVVQKSSDYGKRVALCHRCVKFVRSTVDARVEDYRCQRKPNLTATG